MTARAATVRVTVALIIALAVIGKLGAPQEFINTVIQYQLLPDVLTPYAAGMVIVWEIVTAVLILSGLGGPLGLRSAAVMFGVFLTVTASAVLRGLAIGCGCFEPFLSLPMWGALLLDTLILGLVLHSLRGPRSAGSTPCLEQNFGSSVLLRSILAASLTCVILVAGGLVSDMMRPPPPGYTTGMVPPSVSGHLQSGNVAPMVTVSVDGELVPVAPAALPALYVFTAPGCSVCAADLKAFPRIASDQVIFIVKGEPKEPTQYPERSSVFADAGGLGMAALGVVGFPSYLAVNSRGQVQFFRTGSFSTTENYANHEVWLWLLGL